MLKVCLQWISGLCITLLLCFGSIHYQWQPALQQHNPTYSGQFTIQLQLPTPILDTLLPQQQATYQQPAQGSIRFHQAVLQTAQALIRPVLHQAFTLGAQTFQPEIHESSIKI